jgi:FtsP/CotA-like multicopper oxidase with cupredoxin domain
MWIYAVDGLFIQPQLVESMLFPQGTRYSVMVQLNQTPGNYTMRVASSGLNQKVSGYGYISYSTKGQYNKSQPPVAVQPFIDYGGSNTTANVIAFNSALAAPLISNAPSPTVDVTHFLTLSRVLDAYVWALNGSSFGPPLELVTPLLFDPSSAISSLSITTKNGSWVDIVLMMSGLQPSHPIHKHSNKAYVIGQGLGPFSWSSTAEAMAAQPESFNLVNPPVVDTFYTPATLGTGSWMVVRYNGTFAHVSNKVKSSRNTVRICIQSSY